jgi:protein TonB
VEGVVQVRVAIRLDGTVAEAAVVRSAGHPDLDRAAVDAVSRWRFEPARGEADPALRLADIPVRFDLRD